MRANGARSYRREQHLRKRLRRIQVSWGDPERDRLAISERAPMLGSEAHQLEREDEGPA